MHHAGSQAQLRRDAEAEAAEAAEAAQQVAAAGEEPSTSQKKSATALNTAGFLRTVVSIWPFWSTPSDRRTAFRKAGVLQTGLAPEHTNRSKFCMLDPPPVGRPTNSVSLAVKSPADARKGSAGCFKVQ